MGLDRGWLSELIPPTGYVPDFLNPTPAGPAPAPAAEWDAILASPADWVRQDLDHLARHQGHLGPRLRPCTPTRPPAWPRSHKRSKRTGSWHYWARIRAVLDAGIFYRARTVAEHSAGRLFNDLHTS
ncbi:hypothetical protein [Microtetraspora fusca]|uniref:hypothetical protein n=1 Tax=Microtetraspora fusca TaxID=1997 RepID=UPI0008308A09|nr:hypothetical protein [Microtetraspora fusca]